MYYYLFLITRRAYWFVIDLFPIWEPGNKATRFYRTAKLLGKMQNFLYFKCATEICVVCGGKGGEDVGDYDMDICGDCNGKGRLPPAWNMNKR